jgi:hypothetical protein
LQQRIVQFPRDSRPLLNTRFQPYRVLALQLQNTELVARPRAILKKTQAWSYLIYQEEIVEA